MYVSDVSTRHVSVSAILYCYDCATPATTDALCCSACGSSDLRAGAARPSTPPATVSPPLPFPWDATLRAWPAQGLVLLYGQRGSGKSAAAAQLAPDWWLTSEQTIDQAAASIAWAQGGTYIKPPELREVHTAGDVEELLWGGLFGELVVVDSLSRLGTWTEQARIMEVIEAWCRETDARALVVVQVNKQGQPAGLTEVEHLTTAIVSAQVEEDGQRRLCADKNRRGPLGAALFQLTGRGLERTALPYSYSVEGCPGQYRLVPWPSKGARWDELLARAFQESAEAGWASAARLVEGYPDGVLLPGDVDERRAFAEAHGLRWLEVTDG